MTQVVVAQRMWQRRDTAAAWTSKNPVLAAGEIGVELGATPADTKFKIGDGATPWNDLSYFSGGIKEVVAGDNVTVDNTDPARPVVSATASGGMSNPMLSPGDLILGGAQGAPMRLPRSSDGYALTLVNGLPAWIPGGGGGGGGPPGPKGDPGDTGPAGADGLAATVEVGTVTTGAPGTDAAVENVGTPTAAVLNFTIPRGNPGSGGGGDASFPAVMARVSMGF